MAAAVLVLGVVVAADMVANPPRRLGRVERAFEPWAVPGRPEPAPGEQADDGVELVPAALLTGTLTAAAARPTTGDLVLGTIDGEVRLVRREEQEDGTVVPMLEPEPVLDLGDEVEPLGERGLLGLAFSPDGSRLYVSFTAAADAGAVRVDELVVDDHGRAAPDGRRRLLSIPHPTEFHNGGSLAVDEDGLLWIGVGDGGYVDGGAVYSGNAQDTSTLLGKVLRIDPTPQADGAPYGIPDGNPFVGGGGRPEIWATGARNPWKLSIDPATGDLWIADVGSAAQEELDVLAGPGREPGANLGWDLREGEVPNPDQPPRSTTLDLHEPVHVYSHDGGGCAVIGGVVYRGERLPGLQGHFLFTDLCDGQVRSLAVGPDGEAVVEDLPGLVVHDQPTAVVTGPDDELYVTTMGGRLLRLDPVSG